MNRNYKIILYFAGFLIFLFAIFAIIFNLLKSPQKSDSNQNTGSNQASSTVSTGPVLSSSDETKLKEFVKNSLTLYNNYSYNDFSNLTAIGDYETLAMQQKTQEVISQLQSTLQPGFSQSSEPDMSSFSYKFTKTDTVEALINVKITQGNSNDLLTRSLQANSASIVSEKLVLKTYGQNWLIDDIEIKNN